MRTRLVETGIERAVIVSFSVAPLRRVHRDVRAFGSVAQLRAEILGALPSKVTQYFSASHLFAAPISTPILLSYVLLSALGGCQIIAADAGNFPGFLSPPAGEMALLVYSAHWCQPCRQLVPAINEVAIRLLNDSRVRVSSFVSNAELLMTGVCSGFAPPFFFSL